MIVGLTGSIASGKSEVARILRQKGIPVFDADEAVHDLYSQSAVISVIGEHFPAAIVSGQIDRSRLSREVSGNPHKLKVLEELVHPLVHKKREAFLKRWKGADITVLDIPLLFETGADKGVDATVVITTTPELQSARALERPGMTAEKLEFILARQMPMAEKTARADFVIDNNGSLEHLAREIDILLPRLKARAKDQNP